MTLFEFVTDAGILAAALAAIGSLLAGTWWVVRRIVRIADVVEQLVPNGGHSIKDQVTRIERKLDEHLAAHGRAASDG